MNKDAIINELTHNVKSKIKQIHNDGFYPLESLKKLGKDGLYSSFYTQGKDGLLDSIMGIAEVSRVCVNTGFCAWCQNVLAWYLYSTDNKILKDKFFKDVSFGNILGGTGLSNPIKSYASLESNKLKARRVEGGFLINGALPWVSNIEYGSIFGIVASGEDSIESKAFNIAGIVLCDKDKLELKDKIRFIALNGSATKSIIFKDYFLADEFVLSYPAEKFLLNITPAFLLLQTGIALGCLDLSLELIRASNLKNAKINRYLPFGEAQLQNERDKFYREICLLASNMQLDSKIYLRSVLEARLNAANLVLQANQAAMLHAGSSGYLQDSKESKLLLESYFVALVTPSVRHLYKEIDDIRQGAGVANLWRATMQDYEI